MSQAMKKRDYAAEYRRRIARGLERGLTASQARGHPKKGEKPASKFTRKRKRKPQKPNPKYYEFPDSIEGFKGKPVPTDDELIDLLRAQMRYDRDRFTEIADLMDENLSDLYTLWLYL